MSNDGCLYYIIENFLMAEVFFSYVIWPDLYQVIASQYFFSMVSDIVQRTARCLQDSSFNS